MSAWHDAYGDLLDELADLPGAEDKLKYLLALLTDEEKRTLVERSQRLCRQLRKSAHAG